MELCFFLIVVVLQWESRMKRAFCSATWTVKSSSLVSQVGRLSVRCWKLSRGVIVAILGCCSKVVGVGTQEFVVVAQLGEFNRGL